MNGGSMRRIQEHVLGYKTNVSNSISDIWLLGTCYCCHMVENMFSADGSLQSGMCFCQLLRI
ncbi:hypothetical protein HanPI659440_Chr12g0466851 [Helianthus annuus]|nr:hypothetical protein HanPI659440_Chr12g0466851 [Helianthus annuus]